MSTTIVRGYDEFALYEISLSDYVENEVDKGNFNPTFYVPKSYLPHLEIVQLPFYASISELIDLLTLSTNLKTGEVKFVLESLDLSPIEKSYSNTVNNYYEEFSLSEVQFYKPNLYSKLEELFSEEYSFKLAESFKSNISLEEYFNLKTNIKLISNLLVEELEKFGINILEKTEMTLTQETFFKVTVRELLSLVFSEEVVYSQGIIETLTLVLTEKYSASTEFKEESNLVFGEKYSFDLIIKTLLDLYLAYKKNISLLFSEENVISLLEEIRENVALKEEVSLALETKEYSSAESKFSEEFLLQEKSTFVTTIISLLDLLLTESSYIKNISIESLLELIISEKEIFKVLLSELLSLTFLEKTIIGQRWEEITNLVLEELSSLHVAETETNSLSLVEEVVSRILLRLEEGVVLSYSNVSLLNIEQSIELPLEEVTIAKVNTNYYENLQPSEISNIELTLLSFGDLILSYVISPPKVSFEKHSKVLLYYTLKNEVDLEESLIVLPQEYTRFYIDLETFNEIVLTETTIIARLENIIETLLLESYTEFSLTAKEVTELNIFEEFYSYIRTFLTTSLGLTYDFSLLPAISELLEFIFSETAFINKVALAETINVNLVENYFNYINTTKETEITLTELITNEIKLNEKGELSFEYSVKFGVLDSFREELQVTYSYFVGGKVEKFLESDLGLEEFPTMNIVFPRKEEEVLVEYSELVPSLEEFNDLRIVETISEAVDGVLNVTEILPLRVTAFAGTNYVTMLDFFQHYFTSISGISFNSIYDLKNYDLVRQGNGIFLWTEKQDEDYVGFGNEVFGKYIIGADLYLFGVNTATLLNTIISEVSKLTGDFSANSLLVGGEYIVWLKLLGQRNFQRKMRGATKYRFVFELMTYNAMKYNRYGINMSEV